MFFSWISATPKQWPAQARPSQAAREDNEFVRRWLTAVDPQLLHGLCCCANIVHCFRSCEPRWRWSWWRWWGFQSTIIITEKGKVIGNYFDQIGFVDFHFYLFFCCYRYPIRANLELRAHGNAWASTMISVTPSCHIAQQCWDSGSQPHETMSSLIGKGCWQSTAVALCLWFEINCEPQLIILGLPLKILKLKLEEAQYSRASG